MTCQYARTWLAKWRDVLRLSNAALQPNADLLENLLFNGSHLHAATARKALSGAVKRAALDAIERQREPVGHRVNAWYCTLRGVLRYLGSGPPEIPSEIPSEIPYF